MDGERGIVFSSVPTALNVLFQLLLDPYIRIEEKNKYGSSPYGPDARTPYWPFVPPS
jgi:hypothetical protein